MCIVGFLDLARDDRENETFISVGKRKQESPFSYFRVFLLFVLWLLGD